MKFVHTIERLRAVWAFKLSQAKRVAKSWTYTKAVKKLLRSGKRAIGTTLVTALCCLALLTIAAAPIGNVMLRNEQKKERQDFTPIIFCGKMNKKIIIAGTAAVLGTAILWRLRRINPKGMTAAFLGDSHTAGYGWGWPEKLCEQYGITAVDRRTLAVGGKTTRWGLSTLTSYLLSHKAPDILFIWFGGNDGYSLITNEEAYANINKMIALAKAKGVKHIYVIPGFSTMRVTAQSNSPAITDKHRAKFAKVESLKKGFKKHIKGARVLPLWLEPDNTWSSDGFHIKASGQAIFAKWLGKKIFV